MTDADHEQIRRSAAEASEQPRQVPNRGGSDPSNTPIEELVAPLDDDEASDIRQMLRRTLTEHPDDTRTP